MELSIDSDILAELLITSTSDNIFRWRHINTFYDVNDADNTASLMKDTFNRTHIQFWVDQPKKSIDSLSKKSGTVYVVEPFNFSPEIFRSTRALIDVCAHTDIELLYGQTIAEYNERQYLITRIELPEDVEIRHFIVSSLVAGELRATPTYRVDPNRIKTVMSIFT